MMSRIFSNLDDHLPATNVFFRKKIPKQNEKLYCHQETNIQKRKHDSFLEEDPFAS